MGGAVSDEPLSPPDAALEERLSELGRLVARVEDEDLARRGVAQRAAEGVRRTLEAARGVGGLETRPSPGSGSFDAGIDSGPSRSAVGRRGLAARLVGRRSRLALTLAAAAMLTVLVAAVLWVRRTTAPSAWLESGTRVGTGEFVRAERGPVDLHFSDGTKVTLSPESRGRLIALDANGGEVAIEDGRATVSVPPHQGRSWTIDAGPYRVLVTGTRFDVAWDERARRFDIVMAEGRVEVRGPGASAVAVVAGQHLSLEPSELASTPAKGSAVATNARSSRGADAARGAAEGATDDRAEDAHAQPSGGGATDDPSGSGPSASGPAPGDPAAGAQGLAPSGVAPSGVGPSGVGPSGVGPSGVGSNGVGSNGVGPSGVGSNGVGPSGVGSNGVGPSGVGSNGVGPSGVGSNGVGPNGAPGKDVSGKDAAANGTALREGSVEAPKGSKAGSPVHAAGKGWRTLARESHFEEAVKAAEALGFDAVSKSANAADLLMLADAARLAGRGDLAKTAYTAVRTSHAGTGEAARAAFALGVMAFPSTSALPLLEEYLSQAPGGSLAPEALGRIVEIRHRSGDTAGARTAAERYLASYPKGAHAKLARSILEE
jgi:hypothetical protein